MKHRVYIENAQEEVTLFRGYKTALREVVAETLAFETFPYRSEVSVTLVSTDEIARLNGEYRKKPVPTDVLSFPLNEDLSDPADEAFDGAYLTLGDVFVCPKVILEQSARFGTSFREELSLMVIHSVLHLLGYDHVKKNEKEEMFARQNAVLALCGELTGAGEKK